MSIQFEKILTNIKNQADPNRAPQMERYLKGKGKALGLDAKSRAAIWRSVLKEHPITSQTEFLSLVEECWNNPYRELKYTAVDLAKTYKKYNDENAWPLWQKMATTANWWDTVDLLASNIIGHLYLKKPQLVTPALLKWSNNSESYNGIESFWLRRISLLILLKSKDNMNLELLSSLLLKFAPEQEFFMRKAVGWVLREYSRTAPNWVIDFVELNDEKLSPLSKKEALRLL